MAMFCPDCNADLDEVPTGDPCPQCGGDHRSAVANAAVALAGVGTMTATATIGYNPSPDWTVHWLAVQRRLERLRELYQGIGRQGNLDSKDTIDALFIDLYHLRDWLGRDRSAALSLSAIDTYVSSHPDTLGVCRAYANTRKHKERDNPAALTAQITKSGGNEHGETATIGYWPKDQPASITEADALELAEQSEKDWRDLLTAHGISIPP